MNVTISPKVDWLTFGLVAGWLATGLMFGWALFLSGRKFGWLLTLSHWSLAVSMLFGAALLIRFAHLELRGVLGRRSRKAEGCDQ
jgi:hypothetical protein